MERTIIKGNKGLAEKLGVHFNTVLNWRKSGLLKAATIADYGRVILYDFDLVLECLRHTPVKQGRRAVK
ncbi:MAG: DUF3853 family protein [Bacteroidales bacterium]|nr:DUF3853 family protein [Bacteroidales bacterium]